MAFIGEINRLKVVKQVEFGVYVDGGNLGDILLPKRYVPEGVGEGSELDVFIYNDSEDRLIATTEKPFASVGEFAMLKVVAVGSFGAFMDWGLPKDLLVPTNQQKDGMYVGKRYLVRLYLDQKTNRIAASAKLGKYVDLDEPMMEEGDEVDLLIWRKTDLGYTAIINNAHSGVIYANEIFQTIEIGQKLKGFVKKVRPDGKIDLSLNAIGYEKVGDVTDRILKVLNASGGYMEINDKTEPEVIYNIFGESKKTFKKAIGALYKQRVINITDKGIELID